MSGLLSGINTALKALLSQQASLQVIEHNVSNANTEGYNRQEAVLTTAPPESPAGMDRAYMAGQIGTGTLVKFIRRYSLEFVDTRLRDEQSTASQWDISAQLLSQIEGTLAEASDDGLTAVLGAYWDSWRALSNDPSNLTLRADLLERATNLTDALHRRAESLIQIRKDQDLGIKQRVGEINQLGAQIAKINSEISRVQAYGNQPNDLLDQRDLFLGRLSKLSGIQAHIQDDGSVMVSISGHALVVGDHSFSLKTVQDPTDYNLVDVEWEDGQSFTAENGELAGLFAVRDSYAVDQLDALDSLSGALITRVNQVHRTGYGLNNATNLDFFTGTDALSIRVSGAMSDLNNIAAAAAADARGDNSIADLIAGVQNEQLMEGNTATLSDYYLKETANLGLLIQRSQSYSSERSLVISSLQQQKDALGGVSLDEEAANLMKAQHVYNAATRLMTTVDELIDLVINRMGLVGR